MKKAILTLALGIVSLFNVQAQEIVVSQEQTLYSTEWGGYKRLKQDGEQVYLVYQNDKYSHITDLGLVLGTKEEIKTMLEKAIQILGMDTPTKGNSISLETSKYELERFEFAPQFVYLTDSRGKYTSLDLAHVKSMLEAL